MRLLECRRILKSTGSIYLHIDHTAHAYAKVMMDAIFGQINFRNEIVWQYDGPQGPSKRDFARKHDTILRYSKTNNYTGNVREKHPVSLNEAKAKYKQMPDGRWYYDLPASN